MSKRPRRLRLQRVPFADTLDAEHTPSPRRLHVPISKADDPQRKRRRLHASFAKPVLTESPVVGQTQESHSKEKEGIQDCTPLPPPPLQPVPVRSVQRELKTPTVTPQRRDRMQLRVSLSDLADRQTECRRVRRERNFHVAMICLGKQCLDMPPPLSLKLCEPPTFDLSTDRQSVLPRNASEYRRHRDGPRRFAVDYAVTLRREQVCGAVSRRAARREMRLFSSPEAQARNFALPERRSCRPREASSECEEARTSTDTEAERSELPVQVPGTTALTALHLMQRRETPPGGGHNITETAVNRRLRRISRLPLHGFEL